MDATPVALPPNTKGILCQLDHHHDRAVYPGRLRPGNRFLINRFLINSHLPCPGIMDASINDNLVLNPRHTDRRICRIRFDHHS